MGLFKNKLTLAFDFYNKKTKDWLIQAPVPAMVGNNAPWVNGGDVQNQGYELELNYKTIILKDWALNIGITAATNKSKVLDIPNDEHVLKGGSGVLGQSNLLRAEVGSEMGYFWGYKTAGIAQNDADVATYSTQQPYIKKGDLIFVDVNGDGTITEEDRTNIGSPYPKFTGGLNFGLSWKMFDFNMFWYTALGQKIYNANRRDDLKYVNFTSDAMGRWHGEGTSNDYPRMTINDPNGDYKKVSDFFLEDADYARLKSLSLGISLPKKLTNAVKLSRVRFYYMGENLLTFTKYKGLEVEVGGTPFGLNDNYGNPTNAVGVDHGVYPLPKTHTLGVNIEF
jgi:TonB-dependent starch-binding outer membrane protein SusC